MRTCVRISVSVCDEKCGGGGVVVRVWSCVRVLHLAAMLLFYGAVLKYTRRRILVLVFTFYVLRYVRTFYVLLYGTVVLFTCGARPRVCAGGGVKFVSLELQSVPHNGC